MSEPTGRRRYNSLRRTAQAQQTQAAIARAARHLFVRQGWGATTVREVAREAGVSVPTVYSAYGGKAGLARALMDAAHLSADMAQYLGALEAAGDPVQQLATMVAFDRRLFESSGDVILLGREAGRTEPDLAVTYTDGRRRADAMRAQVFSSWRPGTLREGLDVADAVDIYAALCNIDVYTTLTRERSWGPDEVQRWWSDILPRELLRDPTG